MNSHNSKALFRNLLVITGIAGMSSLLALPGLALTSLELESQKSESILAQAGGGDSGSDGGQGDAYENIQQPDDSTGGAEPLLEQNEMDSNGVNSGSESGSGDMDSNGGSGQGGVDYSNPVNPANPDSTGGEAFERTPGTQPLPDANENSSDMMNDDVMNNDGSSSTTEEGVGGGQGGVDYNNPVNPANPDAAGGESSERAPGNPTLPDSNSQNSPGGSYNSTPGSTSGSGSGSGAGGYNSTTGVRALW